MVSRLTVNLGDMQTKHGHGEGSSPVLYGETLVVNWDHEGNSFVVALDKRSGEELWRSPRDEVTSWGTPVVVEHEGKPQVVISGTERVRGYDLASGDASPRGSRRSRLRDRPGGCDGGNQPQCRTNALGAEPTQRSLRCISGNCGKGAVLARGKVPILHRGRVKQIPDGEVRTSKGQLTIYQILATTLMPSFDESHHHDTDRSRTRAHHALEPFRRSECRATSFQERGTGDRIHAEIWPVTGIGDRRRSSGQRDYSQARVAGDGRSNSDCAAVPSRYGAPEERRHGF